jgi:hypothetical protein
MYCKYCGSENVSYIGVDDGGGDYGDSLVSIFYCDDCELYIEEKDVAPNLYDLEEGYDCIMCGKPTAIKPDTRCSDCEQVWNS